jgi:hypothetical protein
MNREKYLVVTSLLQKAPSFPGESLFAKIDGIVRFETKGQGRKVVSVYAP